MRPDNPFTRRSLLSSDLRGSIGSDLIQYIILDPISLRNNIYTYLFCVCTFLVCTAFRYVLVVLRTQNAVLRSFNHSMHTRSSNRSSVFRIDKQNVYSFQMMPNEYHNNV